MATETLVSGSDKLALKLRILPNSEQAKTLDEAFKKWASICNRISSGKESIDSLRPSSASELQFNSTQLSSATMDVSALKKAKALQGERLEAEIAKLRVRYAVIDGSLSDPTKRHVNPAKPSQYYPAEWDSSGRLTPKFHTDRHYVTELRKLKLKEEKMLKSIAKISSGKIVFKPKRITLWPSSIHISFNKDMLLLRPFANDFEMELPVVLAPQKKSASKSQKASEEYMRNAQLNLIGYSINQLLFGLNKSQKMLANAKKSEKVEKFSAQMEKKKAGFPAKIKSLEGKWLLNRQLSCKEMEIIDEVNRKFFETRKVELSKNYLELLRNLAEEIMGRAEYVNLNKYPILTRRPLKRHKQKNINNLKPEMWKYYIQFGYEPIFERKPIRACHNILGIDRGLTHLLALSVFSPKEQKFIFNHLEPNPIMGWKWKLRKLRRSLQHLERRTRAQKNVHLPEALMKKRLASIENKTEQHYHVLSSKIIELATKYDACIVLESLSNMKQRGGKKTARTKSLDYALSLFDYEKIARLIGYKAKLNGIPVYDINAANTSKTCATCLLNDSHGTYERGQSQSKILHGKTVSRKNMKVGKCSVCNLKPGSMIDADLNAARVIALCKFKGINDPLPIGSRKVFKRFRSNI